MICLSDFYGWIHEEISIDIEVKAVSVKTVRPVGVSSSMLNALLIMILHRIFRCLFMQMGEHSNVVPAACRQTAGFYFILTIIAERR